jgi:hypothetical protein
MEAGSQRGTGISSHMRVAIGLVALATLISSLQIYWHTFLDESENLYFGYRMSQGAVLYRDMFSHHFPFPYWWVAATTALAGKSIAAVRAAGVCFQMAAFATALWVSGAPVAVGVTAVVWSLVGYLYFGNLLILYTFKSLASMVMVAGAIMAPPPSARTVLLKLVLVGIFGAIAVLTDPTAVYFVAVTAGIAGWRFGWRAAVAVMAPGVVGTFATLAWLHAQGNWSAFVEHAFRFNRDVYAVFGRADGSSLRSMFPYDGISRQASTGLRIFDARWWHVEPETPLSLPGSLHDRWVLTGAAYRVSVITLAVRVARRRDHAGAIGLYGFAVLALALRGEEGFHSSTFALIALLSASVLATSEWPRVAASGVAGARLVRVAAAVALAMLAACGAVTLWSQRDELGYAANFGRYEALAAKLDALSCHDPSVRISYWPSDLLVNWFTDRLPISKYAYVLPWTLDVGRSDIEESLRHGQHILLVDLDGTIGPSRNAEYLHDLLATAEERLVSPERGIFVSPELLACGADDHAHGSGERVH